MKKIIEANFHPTLAWHPRAPRADGKYKEKKLWEETDTWNRGKILWLVSPDRKVREPIDYYGSGNVCAYRKPHLRPQDPPPRPFGPGPHKPVWMNRGPG